MNERKIINIDGDIYEQTNEGYAPAGSIANYALVGGDWYRLKPREPRVWEGTISEVWDQLSKEKGPLWEDWPLDVQVRITEVAE